MNSNLCLNTHFYSWPMLNGNAALMPEISKPGSVRAEHWKACFLIYHSPQTPHKTAKLIFHKMARKKSRRCWWELEGDEKRREWYQKKAEWDAELQRGGGPVGGTGNTRTARTSATLVTTVWLGTHLGLLPSAKLDPSSNGASQCQSTTC